MNVTVERKMPAEVRKCLPLGWMLLPTYPGRLGVAGSVLIDNQSKPSTLTTSLLVSTPPTLPVLTFQLFPQERIQEIEKELSALCSQVHSHEQAALKPPATTKPFVSNLAHHRTRRRNLSQTCIHL